MPSPARIGDRVAGLVGHRRRYSPARRRTACTRRRSVDVVGNACRDLVAGSRRPSGRSPRDPSSLPAPARRPRTPSRPAADERRASSGSVEQSRTSPRPATRRRRRASLVPMMNTTTSGSSRRQLLGRVLGPVDVAAAQPARDLVVVLRLRRRRSRRSCVAERRPERAGERVAADPEPQRMQSWLSARRGAARRCRRPRLGSAVLPGRLRRRRRAAAARSGSRSVSLNQQRRRAPPRRTIADDPADARGRAPARGEPRCAARRRRRRVGSCVGISHAGRGRPGRVDGAVAPIVPVAGCRGTRVRRVSRGPDPAVVGGRGRAGCGTGRRRGRCARAGRACVPSSTMRPSSTTTMRSASTIVDRRCAITSAVRPAQRLVERALDRDLRLGVEVRRRLVEDHDRRVLQQQPRDRERVASRRPTSGSRARRRPCRAVGQRRDEVSDARGAAAPRRARRRSRRAARSAGWRGSCRGRGAGPAARSPTASCSDCEREVAHVVPVDPDRALDRVVRSAGRASRSSSCPRPTGPTSATVSPGSIVSDTSRRIQSLGSSSRPACPAPRATRATPSSPGGCRNHTWSNSMRPFGSTRSTAPGRSAISGGKSSTSKTRSKLTRARSARRRASS